MSWVNYLGPRNQPQQDQYLNGITNVKTIDLLLEETGLSIAELANRSQLAPERIDAILSGRWLPNPNERRRLAALVGLAVDEIGWGHSMTPRNVRYQRFGLKENF